MTENGATNVSRGDWYLAHVLALISLVTLLTLFSARLYLEFDGKSGPNLPLALRLVVAAGGFIAFWFWIRILVDYFRERPKKNSVLWGFLLVLGSVIGSQLYFWLIWRRKYQPTTGL